MGAFCFSSFTLAPGEKTDFILLSGIADSKEEIENIFEKYNTSDKVKNALEETRIYWKKQVNVDFHTQDPDFDSYMKWVSFQPFLRRLFGCSFLPHHDYGRGGRGWRDLWQDCLSLLLMNPQNVGAMIEKNYGGVRIDGTNATIIGDGDGNFIADRNGIARIWMDHALWPLITTSLYINQTGDIEILKKQVPYFKDAQTMRGTEIDTLWNDAYGNKQRTEDGQVYTGSVLEHILIQQLAAFYDVGVHNIYRLRGADWNDALDMAAENGESVAFTCAYAGNLHTLASILRLMESAGETRGARFPIINANLYIKNTSTRLFTPYKILRMDGMNILFIGIITQDVINQTKSESLVGSFVDTAAAAAEVGKICNAHNSIDIDFTVLLTHIGFEEDRHLARQLDPAWGVDLIIGGHSHTLPEHAVEENGVVIAQAGTGTDQIGRFDIIVDTDNNCIDSYTWRTVPICAETCPRNPAMEQVLHRFTSQVDEKYSHIVGRFRRELTHPQRTQETELGNLFADIFTRSLGVDVMLIGSGSIRAEKLGPIVTYGDLIEGFPYDDGVFMFKVTGQQLRQMLHYMLREEAYTGHTEFYQLPSTLRLRYDRRKGDFDYFTYCGREVGKEIGDDALFTVGMQNYHFKNIESFFNISYDTLCKLQKPRSVATSCQDILMEYFREHEMLDAVVDGRMTILPPTAREGD